MCQKLRFILSACKQVAAVECSQLCCPYRVRLRIMTVARHAQYDPQNAPFRGKEYAWFRTPNDISIGSAVLAQIMLVTSRQTDRRTMLRR